ncbi:hypothetical protein EJ02DRAFT_5011 [Clathrospora elynae]|uniref:Uncharacterized protein n=1 Tax=Clathrospora elynae TaxID=706981 RepID=A0A6A5T6Q7_9PLEO|nr:hypothetical protein EJ02DRAFT_5011 [Clathrospora elynae]
MLPLSPKMHRMFLRLLNSQYRRAVGPLVVLRFVDADLLAVPQRWACSLVFFSYVFRVFLSPCGSNAACRAP